MYRIFSGGVAGTIASCITNPLEVIKTQLQSSNTVGAGRGHPVEIAQKIFSLDGPAGFWRGLAPTLIGIIPSRSAYFYAYQRCKHALGPYLPEGSPANAMVAGFAAGLTGNTLTSPIWMVRTRVVILADASAGQRAYTGYRDAISTIFREEGIGGFYKGIQASYWGCSEGAIQFILYEQMKTRLLKRHNEKLEARGLPPDSQLTKATIFWSAALAKMCAAVTTYPHEVARTRMREQARSGVFKYRGMWQTISLVAKEEGRQGLYSGMGIHLVKVVPNSALMFLTYEVVRTWLSGFAIVDE
jgi:solute carrier family 25 protein 33/36